MPKKATLPKSTLKVTLTFRSGGVEISAAGEIGELAKEMTSIKGLLDLATSGETEASYSGSTMGPSITGAEDFKSEAPVIKASKSTTENIRALFATSWGRTPRAVGEVMAALEANAVPDKIEAVNLALIREVKKGNLRRLKKEGKWVYFKVPET